MFTGLIEEIGSIAHVKKSDNSFDLTIHAKTILEGAILGDSIAVNGVCLTITHFTNDQFTVGLAPETRNRTNLGALKAGDRVNLERAVTPTTRLGGHFVQGHVDTIGTIKNITPDEDALWITVQTSPELMRYIVTKGYITIDGTSLTIVDTGPDWFNITLIAYSQSKVILSEKKIGDSVNLEVDILAKYVERITTAQNQNKPASPLTREFLSDNGFFPQGASS